VTLDELLANVDLAVNGPRTLYLLGEGGWYADAGVAPAHPGTLVRPHRVLARMQIHDPAKYQRHLNAAQQAGINLQALPQQMPASDCSGFVTWALGLPRAPSRSATSGWLDTERIWGDARAGRGRFEWCFSRYEPRRASIGALLVYPDHGAQDGHIGIVTAVDAAGTPIQVVHCAPENYLRPAAPGQRHAILQDDAQMLLDHADCIAAWCVDVTR